MSRSPGPHRWDNDIRDTRIRESRIDSVAGWHRTADSTFDKPSRLDDRQRPPQAKRPSAMRVTLGLAAILAAGAVILWLRAAHGAG